MTLFFFFSIVINGEFHWKRTLGYFRKSDSADSVWGTFLYSDMIVYDSHICIFIKRDSLKTPSTENKNVNKEKYVNKETCLFADN